MWTGIIRLVIRMLGTTPEGKIARQRWQLGQLAVGASMGASTNRR